MKTKILFLPAILFCLIGCQKNHEIDDVKINNIQKEVSIYLTAEQQKMKDALCVTTDVLLNMILKDELYFKELNRVIVAGSPNCLEDRVLLKDLFGTNPNGNSLRVKADIKKFASDFNTAFYKKRPQKAKSIDSNERPITNPDELIQLLSDNNVSLYCPYPLEDYAQDNQIPTITFHPIDNDSINTGYLIDEISGEVDTVIVNQRYADNHPVWILMPYENELSETPDTSIPTSTIHGYEVMVRHVYCRRYYDGLFEGDQDVKICRTTQSLLTFDSNKNTFTGGFTTVLDCSIPRKYVGYAKNGWNKGWYLLNLLWDSNWDEGKTSNIIFIYEWDNKTPTEISIPLYLYDNSGKPISTIGTYKTTYQSYDAIICQNEWSRPWFFDFVKNGNPLWSWQHSSGANYKTFDGDYVNIVNNDFYLTMRIRPY